MTAILGRPQSTRENIERRDIKQEGKRSRKGIVYKLKSNGLDLRGHKNSQVLPTLPYYLFIKRSTYIFGGLCKCQ